jgi:hypothetical protein
MSDKIGLVSFAEDRGQEFPSAAKLYSSDTVRYLHLHQVICDDCCAYSSFSVGSVGRRGNS